MNKKVSGYGNKGNSTAGWCGVYCRPHPDRLTKMINNSVKCHFNQSLILLYCFVFHFWQVITSYLIENNIRLILLIEGTTATIHPIRQ